MNTDEYKKAVEAAVAARNFHEAFRLLAVMLPAGAGRMRDDLQTARDDYERIVGYALTGAPDPGREAQISALSIRIYTLLDMLIRESMVADSASLYFGVVRTLRLRRGESLASLIGEYRRAAAGVSAFAASTLPRAELQSRRRVLEDLEERVFDRVWTSVPLTFDELASLRDLMNDTSTSLSMKSVVVGALTMSLIQFFSESGLRLLLDFADGGNDEEVQLRATIGAVLVMARWPRRSDSASLHSRLASLRDGGRWSGDVEQAIMQIIRMADVEKITRTMQDEIIPEMMKLRPDIEKHIKEGRIDPTDGEINPEWEEMLDKSGLSERLRKFSELQFEGGDIFFAAFSALKTYPFFSHIAHWFLPFDADRRDVADALGHDDAFGMMLAESTAMCSSDKYSFVLSLDRLPDAQKQMVLSQLSEANVKLAEMTGAELMPEKARREALIRGYVQDLYRFFKLFRRSAEFENPFDRLINPATIPALRPDVSEPGKIRLLGEFYFKHGHFDQALALFRTLRPDLTLHQKMGHALQRLGRPSEALVEYERAELLAPDSEWTLRRLAQLNKSLGRYEKALEYFNRLEIVAPDRPETALQTAYCHIELGRIHEALHCCYKAEMLDEKSPKPLRPIAWCSFLNGDYETARRYYERIFVETTPTPADYLNMGHLEFAQGNMREALNFYKLYSADVDALAASFADDMPLLQRAGIDTSALPLLLDAIRFENDNR